MLNIMGVKRKNGHHVTAIKVEERLVKESRVGLHFDELVLEIFCFGNVNT